jgi:D-alanyl-D-alanine carboxypeptidase
MRKSLTLNSFALFFKGLAQSSAKYPKIFSLSLLMLLPVLASAQAFDLTWATKLQSTLDSVVLVDGIRGASVGVYAPGMGTWHGVSGASTTGVPITPDMEFGIGSNTKLFIAVLALKLQEQGVLSLDDPLDAWLPSLQYIDSSATIRQLLNHQTGFYDYVNDNGNAFWLDSIWGDTSRVWTAMEVMASIGPPHFAPGASHRYSNTNYVLAGMVIEAATGQPWYQQLRSQILNPLNLDSTFAGAYEAKIGNIAHPLAYDSIEIMTAPITSEYTSVGGPGGLFSNCSELLQWYDALFTGQIVSDSSLQQLEDFEPLMLYGLGLGNGLIAGWAGEEMSYHTGQMLGYCSLIMYDHKTGAVLCVLTNNAERGAQLFRPMISVFDQFPLRSDDAGISKVLSPYAQECSSVIVPQVVIQNFGINALTSATINYSFDNGAVQNFAWSGSLNTHDSAIVSLPSATLAWGRHSLKCNTSLPNGANDRVVLNDTIEHTFLISNTSQPAAYSEDFENAVFPPLGCSANPATVTGWRRTSLADHTGHACMTKNNFHDPHLGKYYDFDLPYFNLSSLSIPELSFDYAYSTNQFQTKRDSLVILLSADCGNTWDTLFYKGGNSLRTAPASVGLFVPTANQWRQQLISLSGYSGDVIIRFRDVCYSGNNLFIDNIQIDNANATIETKPENKLCIYPNPFIEAAWLKSSDEIIDGVLLIYDCAGREMQGMDDLVGKEIRIERKSLAPGFYTFKLLEEGIAKGTGRFIVR